MQVSGRGHGDTIADTTVRVLNESNVTSPSAGSFFRGDGPWPIAFPWKVASAIALVESEAA
jgi:hypothetical protein